MKTLILASLLVLSTGSAQATKTIATRKPASAEATRTPSSKEFTFKFKLNGESLEIKRSGKNYEEAYEAAALQCFQVYKAGKKLSEDQGLDIIDVCANPRT